MAEVVEKYDLGGVLAVAVAVAEVVEEKHDLGGVVVVAVVMV